MGILGKIVGVGASALGAGFEAIGQKLEDVFVKREQKNLEYIANYPYANKYTIIFENVWLSYLYYYITITKRGSNDTLKCTKCTLQYT